MKWYDKLDLNGSLRLRYEAFDWDDHYDDGRRDRFRYRFRIGVHADVSDNVMVGFQLANANPTNPISDNQTFDDGLLVKTTILSVRAQVDDSSVARARVHLERSLVRLPRRCNSIHRHYRPGRYDISRVRCERRYGLAGAIADTTQQNQRGDNQAGKRLSAHSQSLSVMAVSISIPRAVSRTLNDARS